MSVLLSSLSLPSPPLGRPLWFKRLCSSGESSDPQHAPAAPADDRATARVPSRPALSRRAVFQPPLASFASCCHLPPVCLPIASSKPGSPQARRRPGASESPPCLTGAHRRATTPSTGQVSFTATYLHAYRASSRPSVASSFPWTSRPTLLPREEQSAEPSFPGLRLTLSSNVAVPSPAPPTLPVLLEAHPRTR